VCARRRAVDRLGDREAVRVVLHADLAPERACEVLVQRPAVEPGRVRVLHPTRERGDRARDAHADAAALGELAFGVAHERDDRRDRARVVVARRRHPAAQARRAAPVEGRDLDLRATQVDADAKRHDRTGCGGVRIGR
jgi:hypothetical protein